MLWRIVSGGGIAALAGAAMLALSAGPSAAFTLSAPSLEQPVASAGVEPVWWDRWGRWHPNGWGWHRPWGWGWGWHRPWGWHPRYYAYYGPVRHCWIGPWGVRHCRWW